jgi:tRNA (cytidine/uridine-2'-O-)-methyltransferase
MPFHVVLHRPEIPPNTGNAIRLCANTGADLHLIRPLGFELDDRRLRRAGLDYHEWTRLRVHQDLASFFTSVAPVRAWALSTRGRHYVPHTTFQAGDALVFGCETAGLPDDELTTFHDERVLRLPMVPGNRSLNLSNSVAVTVFEGWRQLGYPGSDLPGLDGVL